MAHDLYTTLLIAILVMAAFTYYGAVRNISPYGRHLTSDATMKTLPSSIAWPLFECPQLFAFAATFWLTAAEHSPVAITLFVLWQAHYLHRGILYPLRRNDQGKRFPVLNVVMGFLFNLMNGYVNGYAVSHAEHLLGNSWFASPWFVVGLIVAVGGWLINFQADTILIKLRSDGSTGYKIPYGGFFRYVSSANYFGEILLWCGWAMMSHTAAGVVFVLFTLSNLYPRAISSHRWYLEKFPDYPKERKAIIPFCI